MAEELAVSERINAPADRVYDMLADLTRMGEWSPETTRIAWVGGATGPAPGARFRGSNKNGVARWSTLGTIVTAERPKEVAWDVSFMGLPVARWGYRIEGDTAGCTVTETWEDRRGPFMKIVGMSTGAVNRREHNERSMRETLRRLKAAAESGT